MKDFITLKNLKSSELLELIELGLALKKRKHYPQILKEKILGLIFQKPSLRTRVSFEVGISKLGGKAVYLSNQDIGLGKREPIKDIARTLSKYLDGVILRLFSHSDLLEFKKYSEIPVINALTDLLHPCQILGDLITIKEIFKSFKKVKIAFIGDGNNVCHSLIYGTAKLNIPLNIATPEKYKPKEEIIKNSGHKKLKIFTEPKKAIKDSDIIYTDVWVSMGQEKEAKTKIKAFKGFQLNKKLLKYCNKTPFIMHCLPAKRGAEVTDDILESENSLIFLQAENRLYAQMAILTKIYKK